MSQPLPGEHLCEKHQGNHAHYAEHNCTICKLKNRLQRIEDIISQESRSELADKIVAVLDDENGWENIENEFQ